MPDKNRIFSAPLVGATGAIIPKILHGHENVSKDLLQYRRLPPTILVFLIYSLLVTRGQ